MSKYVITEGVESTWHYHWSMEDNFTQALCGVWTMSTSMRPEQWGFTGHLHERYCLKCAEIKAGVT